MLEILRELCSIDGTSGDEGAVRDYIIDKIKGSCEYKTDALGNIIAFKKGKKTPEKKIMLDAHTDEVGFIITSVTQDGFLKFANVGGINTEVMMFRRVLINGRIPGVIGGRPKHLLKGDEVKKLPKAQSLYIDIGAGSKEEAEELVSVGDRAVMCSEYVKEGEKIKMKALDDRIGCAVLIKLLKEESEYDFYASFSVQEEVGMRGAAVSAFSVAPDAAIILEGTTAADIADVPYDKQVCVLGDGAVISFMDRAAVYDRGYFDAAVNSGIKCQVKRAVAGGNNSGAVHLSREGVRTLAISVPCRYIHSASSVADERDILSAFELARYMINGIGSGEIA